jgi:hypothetical protein
MNPKNSLRHELKCKSNRNKEKTERKKIEQTGFQNKSITNKTANSGKKRDCRDKLGT